MNSLENLVRDTLAARAHDVDTVELNLRPADRGSGRRWIAISTVVAVAAAILVAIVLVAPWNTTPRATAAAYPTPPAGMQWVSFHGITLTVPAAWSVGGPSQGAWPARDGVVFEVPCGKVDCYIGPPTSTVVALTEDPATTALTLGTTTTVDGRPAYRTDSHYGTVDGAPDPPLVRVTLPDARVTVTIYVPFGADVDATVRPVLDAISYTPVDHYGCTVQPSSVAGGAPGRIPDADLTAGVVCEYGGPFGDSGTSLLGSRILTDADLTALRTVLATAEPAPEYIGGTGRLGGHNGMHVYRLTRADGSTLTVDVDLRGNPVVVTDGDRVAVLPEGPTTPVDVPHAYPGG